MTEKEGTAMDTYRIEKLAHCGPRDKSRAEEFETRVAATIWADDVVREWREAGYKGGAQLVTMSYGQRALLEVYGRDFK